MGAKDISKTMTLKDGVSGILGKISAGTVRYKKQLRDLKTQGDDTWKSMKSGLVGLAAGVAAYAGFDSLISFLNDSADAANEANTAQSKLVAVMQNVKGTTDQGIQSIVDYTTVLQNKGVVEGDSLVNGAQMLGTFQLQTSTIKSLLSPMADLLAQQKGVAATSEDAAQAGILLGKAMTGQYGALNRVGINFTAAQQKMLKYGNEQQRAATLAQVLKQNVGGVNEALGKTDQGKIAQATNAFGDLKETIGGVVLFIKAQFSRVFMENLPQIQKGVQNVADAIQGWAANGGISRLISGAAAVASGIRDVWNISTDTYNFFNDNWSLISPIVYGIAAGFVAYKLSLVGASLWTTIFGKETTLAAIKTTVLGIASLVASGEIGIMTGAMRLLNAAFRANPIGFVITALGVLITVGTLVVKNWETVELAGMKTWNAVVGAAEWGVNEYVSFANTMFRAYDFAWDSIEYAGISIWDGIIDAGEAGVNGFISLINTMVGTAVGGLNKLIGGANKVSKALGLGSMVDEISFNGFGKVDYSGAKIDAKKPSWDDTTNLIPKVDFSGAKFSDDAIMKQTQKAQAERDKNKNKKDAALVNALNANTAATGANTSATNANTKATLKGGNGSAMDIADGLLNRLDRHLWAT